jgi:hypothetical protein
MKNLKIAPALLAMLLFVNTSPALCEQIIDNDGRAPAVAYNSKADQFYFAFHYDEHVPGFDGSWYSTVQGQLFEFDSSSFGPVRWSKIGPQTLMDKVLFVSSFSIEKPQVVYNPDDNEFMVVWAVRGIEPYHVLLCQRFNAYGNPVGKDKIINIAYDGAFNPQIAYNHIDKYYLVSWEVWDDSHKHKDIYAGRVERNGEISRTFSISTKPYDQINHCVAYNEVANEFLFVWEDHYWGWGDDWDINARRVTGEGPVSKDFLVSWEKGNHRSNPTVLFNSINGNYFLAWEYEYSSKDRDIHGRFLNSDGSFSGQEFLITSRFDNEEMPKATYNSDNGDMMVAWMNNGDNKRQAYSKLLSGDGRSIRTIKTADSESMLFVRPVYYSKEQAYFIIWTSWGGINVDVFDSDGNPI